MPKRVLSRIDAKLLEVVGRQLFLHRTRLGVTQEWISDRCNQSAFQVSRVERGAGEYTTLKTIFQISKALDLSLEELFRRVEQSEDFKQNIP